MWVRPNEPSRQQHQRHSRLCRCIQHLSNVLNHFWKRWRNEYHIELQNSHRYLNQNDTIKTVSVGDVAVVHKEDQPRGKWRVAKILDLIARLYHGSFGPSPKQGRKMHETQAPSAGALPFIDAVRSSCPTQNKSELKPES